MVAVQNRLQIHEKSFEKNKAQEKNLAIKSTDKELFLIESVYVQKYFWRASTWGKNQQYQKGKCWQMEKFNFLAKF